MAQAVAATRRARFGRAVFELYLLSACILIGFTGLLLPSTRAKSLIYGFPPWAQIGWYGGLAISGLLAWSGILRGDVLGNLIERGAMIILAAMCASFGVASVTYAGPPAITGSMMLFGFACPCIVRTQQITRDIRATRAELAYRATMTGEFPIVTDETL